MTRGCCVFRENYANALADREQPTEESRMKRNQFISEYLFYERKISQHARCQFEFAPNRPRDDLFVGK